MTNEEFTAILEAVVAQTGMERFRVTTDPSHPEYVPGARESVVMIYHGERHESPIQEPPPTMELPGAKADLALLGKRREQIRRQRALQRLVRECPYREVPPGCGCQGVKCWARYGGGSGGERANQAECEACVSALVRFDTE